MVNVMLMVSASPSGTSAHAAVCADVTEALATEWRELSRNTSEPNAFGDHWFVGPALLHLRGDHDVKLVEVRSEDGGLIGIIPLTHYGRYGRMPVRHVSNWTHYQCFMGTPLIKADYEAAFWQAVITLLDGSDWAAGLLTVSGLLEDGPVQRGLTEAARSLNRPCPAR
jgi:hypothetical protein